MSETFLDALTDEEVADLHAAGRRRAYGPGVTLFHEADDSGPVVVLLSGRVKVATVGVPGREAIIAVRGPGDLIGELSAIDGGPRSATVTAATDLVCYGLTFWEFRPLVERNGTIAWKLLQAMAKRLRAASGDGKAT
jgi:CRP-like cAMP-binding protein